jgi:hypothetical protein
MKNIQIKVDMIDKTQIYVGKVHKFLNCTMQDNKNGKDQYGNDGFITQNISKEKRDAGERGAIIGNWKEVVFAPQSELRILPNGSKLNPTAPIDNDVIIPF